MTGIEDNNPSLWLSHFPLPQKDDNKYTRGHAVIIGGGEKTGAAQLAATAALRCGAGLASISCPKGTASRYAGELLSVMVHEEDGKLLEWYRDVKASAALIGPGTGVNERTIEHTLTLLGAAWPCVLDADVFTAFKEAPDTLFAAIKEREVATVMTPHEGEFSRLFIDVKLDNRIKAAQTAAERSGAIMLLKGPETVIASPEGQVVINSNAPPFLAVAGAGDVLAGMMTGLLAHNMPAFEAACAAAWIHGECGNRCGVGLIAEDLIRELPAILAYLNEQS